MSPGWLILLLLLILGTTGDALARETTIALDPAWMVDRWGLEDGLPLAHTNELALDRQGFLWITTYEGLVRFDGATMRTWQREELPGLRSNRLTHLNLAPDGHLLVTDDNGFVYRIDPSARPLRAEVILEGAKPFLVTWGGQAWGYDNHQVWAFDRPSARLLLSLPPGPLEPIVGVTDGGEGTALVQTLQGWSRLWPDGRPRGKPGGKSGGKAEERVLSSDLPRGELVLSFDTIHPLLDPDGSGWVLHDGLLRRLRGDRVETLPWVGPPPLRACRLWRDKLGVVRLYGSGGAWRVEGDSLVPEGERLSDDCHVSVVVEGQLWHANDGALWRDEQRVTELPGIGRQVLPDGAGGLWLSTDGGLLHLRPARARTIPAMPGDEVPSMDIVRWDGQHLWAASIDGSLGLIEAGSSGEERLRPVEAPRPMITPLSIRPLHDGTMGGLDHSVRVRMNAAGQLERLLPALTFEQAGAWLPTPDGAHWSLGTPGLFRSAPGGGPWTEVLGPSGSIPLARDVVPLGADHVALLAPGPGILFSGPPDIGPPDRFEARSGEDALPSGDIRSARLDADPSGGGTLWIGTEDAGLCRLRPISDPLLAPLRCASVAAGLGNANVHNSLDDGQGRLWLGTNRGVLLVEKALLERALDGEEGVLTALRLDERDGFVNGETNGGQWSVERTADGRLWFPTMGGVVVIDPSRWESPDPPGVTVDTVRVNGVERSSSHSLHLASDERELAIGWTVPEFVRPDQLRFRYRLEGIEAEWREGTVKTEARWTNLPPGAATFVLQASLGGDWGPALRIAVERAPSFIESRWFPFSLVLGSVLVTAAGAAFSGRQRRRRQRELEDTVKLRTTELRAAHAATLEQAGRIEAQARQLSELNVTRSRFVANISHELRTPLMLVMSSLDELRSGTGAVEPERSGPVDLALRNADRLRQLIDQLFDLVRLEAGRLPMRARRIRIGRFLEELVSRHRPIAMARGLELILDLPALGTPELNAGGRPIILWADPDLLEKAVGNLLSNALKFTPKGGAVGLSLTIDAGEVRVVVRDEGPGVAAQHRERIFERYYQAESGGHRSAEGAGIGLSLARELAELQGGSLQLLEGGAAGATFALCLPSGTDHLSVEDIGLDEPSDPSFQTPIRPPSLVGSRPRVLLVEDHPELRAYLSARLSEELEVEAVGDGETALLRLRAGGFGLLLSDIMMPGMDGIDLCRAVRADPALQGLPVVLLSAKGPSAEAEARAAGADRFLSKPILASELMRSLRELLPYAEPIPEEEAPPATEPTRPDAAPLPSELPPAGESPLAVESGQAPLSEVERAQLDRLLGIARARMKEPAFTVEVLAGAVAMSPRTLQRAINRLTGKAPSGWLQELRLETAQGLLRRGGSVSEAADAVGMAPAYFSRVYKAWFGYPPSREERSRGG